MLKDIRWEPVRRIQYTYRAWPWVITGIVLASLDASVMLWYYLGTGCPNWLEAITGVVTTPLAVCFIAIGACYHYKSHQTVRLVVLLTVLIMVFLITVGLGPSFIHWLHMKHHFPF